MNRTAASSLALASLATVALGAGAAQAQSLRATPVTTANLPSTTVVGQAVGVHYRVDATRTNTRETVSACQKRALKAYAPNRVITRDYSAGRNHVAMVQVASFASHARAVAVASELGRNLKGCAARTAKANPDLTLDHREYYRSVTLPSGQTAWLQTMTMHDGETGHRFIVEDGVTVTGTHVEFLLRGHGGTTGTMDTRSLQKTLTRTVVTLAR